MSGEDFIDRLVGELKPASPRPLARRLVVGAVGGAAIAGALMLAWLGTNPDMPSMMRSPTFWMKLAYGAALGLAGLLAAARLARPGGGWGRLPLVALGIVVTVVAIGAWRLITAPPPMRGAMVMGESALVCPWLIGALALPVAAGLVWAMRGFAPVRLRQAGAAVGLAAGGIATMIYSIHCPENAAPFIALWYTLGMAGAAFVGWLSGPRLLRW